MIIPSTQQALDITAPGFLQSINACPGPSFNGIPCTPFLTGQSGRLAQHSALLPEEGFQSPLRLCLSSVRRHQDRHPRRRRPLHHDHSGRGVLLAHRHQQLRRSRVHQQHHEQQAALPVAADLHRRQRGHVHHLRQRVLRHRQRSEFQGSLLHSVEPQRGARPRLEYRIARLLHRPALRAVALGAGTEPASTFDRSVRAASAHRPAVPLLGPHQHSRYRSQLDLQLAADRSHASHAERDDFEQRLDLGEGSQRRQRSHVQRLLRRNRRRTCDQLPLPPLRPRQRRFRPPSPLHHHGGVTNCPSAKAAASATAGTRFSMRSAAAGTPAASSCCRPVRT